jgi:hypothetical protein
MLTRTDIENYFLAEKTGGALLLVLGSLCILTSLVFLLLLKTPFYKGAAWPLVLAGLAFCFVGFTVHQRSDGDRIAQVYALDMNPDSLKSRELPRMELVMKRFALYRYTEIALIVLGLTIFTYCRWNYSFPFWKGLGAALAIVAICAQLFDHFAEKRGAAYHKKLSAYCAEMKGPEAP